MSSQRPVVSPLIGTRTVRGQRPASNTHVASSLNSLTSGRPQSNQMAVLPPETDVHMSRRRVSSSSSSSSSLSGESIRSTPRSRSLLVPQPVADGSRKVPAASQPATPSAGAVSPPVMKLRRVNMGRKELIGKGSFGHVFRAIDMDTNAMLAVKEMVIVPGTMPDAEIEKIRKEISVMQRLDHPNVVKCFGEQWDKAGNCLRIFMQYVSGGTISSLLRGFGPFTERQAVLYVRQILQGLSYLHNQRIAHRDLKGDNLLVDPDGTLKLADFGTAKELMTKTSRSIAGTAFFMAPEVITGVGHGCEADVWSLGCCVIEMLTGKPPFSQFENHYAIMVQVAELSDTNFLIPSGFSSSCTDFLRQCLRKVAQERGTCAQLLQHPWISESRPEPHIGELTVTFTPAAAGAAAAAAVATRAGKIAPERAPPDVSEGPGPSLDSFNPMPPE